MLLALTGTAFAADPVASLPVDTVPAPALSWTGAYLGVQAGHLWADGSFKTEAHPEVDANGQLGGWLGGVYAGYDHQFSNNLVLGVDADFAWYGVDDFVQFKDPTLNWPAESGIKYKLEWGGSARVRAGYAMDRFMPYVAGGVAFAQADVASYFGGKVTGRAKPNLVGWTLGAGVDYAMTDNVIARAEFRYVDLGTFDHTAGNEVGHGDIKGGEVRLGVAYRF